MLENLRDSCGELKVALAQSPDSWAMPGGLDGFADIGRRMLLAWAEGVRGLRDERTCSAPNRTPGAAFDGLSKPAKLKGEMTKVGRSPLLGKR